MYKEKVDTVLNSLFGERSREIDYTLEHSEILPERFLEVTLEPETIPPAPTEDLKIFAIRPHPKLVIDLDRNLVYEDDYYIQQNILRGEVIRPLAEF